MRFAVSLLSFRPGRVGGAETYVRELLAHLPEAARGDELACVLHPEADEALPLRGLERVLVPWSDPRLAAARMAEAFTPWRARGLEALFADLGADAVLFPQQSIFPLAARVRAVLTVVDLQHLTHPENVGLFDRAFRAGVYGPSLRRAARVIAISEFTRREVIRRCGIAPERVVAVPLGVRPPPATPVPPWTGAGGPYLYYPAASWPHKDHETLFRSYAALRRGGALEARLVLSGARTAHWRRLARLLRELELSRDVVHLGFLPAAEVERVYAGARAVVFPSRHEGFGIPVVEAARLGVPAITSRLPVFDEIGVPASRQIDFTDPAQLRGALAALGSAALAHPPLGWAEVARRTVEVLRETAGAAVNPGGAPSQPGRT